MMTPDTHHYRWIDGDPDTAPVILLHGTYGNEDDLLDLARRLAPRAAALAIRGSVALEYGFAFFNRLPDRRVDHADIAARSTVLTDFIETVIDEHTPGAKPLLVGFSNGAIMATALVLTRPELFSGAILFRPLRPFDQPTPVDLSGFPVLVVEGMTDTRRSRGDGRRVADDLSALGASVTFQLPDTGHAISDADAQLADEWLRMRG